MLMYQCNYRSGRDSYRMKFWKRLYMSEAKRKNCRTVIRTPDKKIKKKRKRKGIEENEDGGENKKQKRANYFVSLPILNPKILGDISTFQDAVLKKEPKLSRAMVPKGSFHLTLFVTHLANEEEVSLAASSFLEIKRPVEEILDGNPLILSFRGVTEFRNEVVFGKITEGDSQATLKKISEAIERIFKEKGIIAFGYKGFVPHLTFIKLSRSPKLRRQGLKKINASLYEDFKEHTFGEELMARLDLCSMLKKRQENGYYHTEASIYFGGHQRDALIQTALHRDIKPLKDKLMQIKEILVLPETQEKIYKELFGIQPIKENKLHSLLLRNKM